MFSWICPKCGSEVPPSYSECPNCTLPAGKPAVAAPPPPPRQQSAPPPPPPRPSPMAPRPATAGRQATPVVEDDPIETRRPPRPAGFLFGGEAPPGPIAAPPPGYAPPPPSSGMPSWLVTLLVVLVVGGIVAGAVWLKQRSSATPAELADSAAGTVTPAAAGGHRLAKYVEVAGFRLAEDAKGRANVKMIIVNHSAADLTGLTMTVTLKTPEGKVVGTADVKVPEVGPLASADVTAPFKTTERAYELPDWQFLRADFRITSP